MIIAYPKEVEQIIERIECNNHSAYIVGGCVRDSLLDKKPIDWDICTSAKPHEIIRIFSDFKTIPTGIKHGTITLLMGNQSFEITTYRIEKGYTDNRRPDSVEFTDDLMQDLCRRDFTINAMAYNKNMGLIDSFKGLNDLENKLIVSVGAAEQRFQEDALRILRGVRLASQLAFNIQEDTLKSMHQCRGLLHNVSKERIRDELVKIILSSKPSYGIRLLVRLGISDIIIPELNHCVGFDQRNNNHDKDIFEHIMTAMDNTECNLVLRLAALLHDIGKPNCLSLDENGKGHFYGHHVISMEVAEDILRRLKFDNKTIESVKILVKEHMSRYDFLRNSNIRKFIRRVGTENLDNLFKLQIADIKGSKPPHDFENVIALKNECEEVISEEQPLSVKNLDINGNDIIALGYKQGKEIGLLLKYLLELVLENPKLNIKETLIQLLINKKVNEERNNG